ncbi:hypothetical protein [Acidithiobacillus sp.]|jgi:hypothetical protein
MSKRVLIVERRDYIHGRRCRRRYAYGFDHASYDFLQIVQRTTRPERGRS